MSLLKFWRLLTLPLFFPPLWLFLYLFYTLSLDILVIVSRNNREIHLLHLDRNKSSPFIKKTQTPKIMQWLGYWIVKAHTCFDLHKLLLWNNEGGSDCKQKSLREIICLSVPILSTQVWLGRKNAFQKKISRYFALNKSIHWHLLMAHRIGRWNKA